MEVRITHQGRALAELEILQDGQVRPIGGGAPQGAAQYVWGGQPGAAQYVWGAQPGAAQYVWGAQPGAAQYVWGGAAQGGAQYVWGAQPGGAAQYVWGATNTRPGGVFNEEISVDCPATTPVEHKAEISGTKVIEGLIG